jgi:uncharacterized membrane protein
MSDIETSNAAPLPEPVPEKPRGFGSRIRTYFLTGLVVAGPLFITTYITWTFITWVDDLVRPMVPVAYRPETYLPWTLPGTGLVIAFVALTLLGFLTANLVGRTFVEIGEWFVGRMPLVSSVYKGLKQVFETLFSGSGTTFRKTGLVQFPAPGQWSLVFFSQPPGPDISAKLPNPEEYVSVFLPCTPNPTTGFFFYVPRSEVIELDITTEDAAKLIMSAGLIQPNGDHQGKLSALAQATRAMRAARDKHLPTPAK